MLVGHKIDWFVICIQVSFETDNTGLGDKQLQKYFLENWNKMNRKLKEEINISSDNFFRGTFGLWVSSLTNNIWQGRRRDWRYLELNSSPKFIFQTYWPLKERIAGKNNKRWSGVVIFLVDGVSEWFEEKHQLILSKWLSFGENKNLVDEKAIPNCNVGNFTLSSFQSKQKTKWIINH